MSEAPNAHTATENCTIYNRQALKPRSTRIKACPLKDSFLGVILITTTAMTYDYYAYHHRPNNEKKKHENRSRTETGWVARRLAQPPPHQPPNPGRQPPQTNRGIQRNPRNARIPAQARPQPPPPSFQSIGGPPRQHKTHDAAQAPAGAAKSDAEFRNGGSTGGGGGQPQRRPAGWNSGTTTTTRARALAGDESAINVARRPTDTQRRNETGVRVRTGGAGGGG